MQHLVLYFQHGIEDILPWYAFIEKLRPQLAGTGVGAFVGDDMAIDGGDCEAIFQSSNVEELFAVLAPHLRSQPFLQKPTTRIEVVFGDIHTKGDVETAELQLASRRVRELPPV